MYTAAICRIAACVPLMFVVSSSGSSRWCCVSASGVLYVGWARGAGRARTFQMPIDYYCCDTSNDFVFNDDRFLSAWCNESTALALSHLRCWLGAGPNVVDRMCCCNLLLKANGMATAMLRRVAWVPGACGRFFFGGKQTSKQAKLKRRQQGRSTAKRI